MIRARELDQSHHKHSLGIFVEYDILDQMKIELLIINECMGSV